MDQDQSFGACFSFYCQRKWRLANKNRNLNIEKNMSDSLPVLCHISMCVVFHPSFLIVILWPQQRKMSISSFARCGIFTLQSGGCLLHARRVLSTLNQKQIKQIKLSRRLPQGPPHSPIIQFWHKAGCHVGLMYAPQSQNLKWLHNAVWIREDILTQKWVIEHTQIFFNDPKYVLLKSMPW